MHAKPLGALLPWFWRIHGVEAPDFELACIWERCYSSFPCCTFFQGECFEGALPKSFALLLFCLVPLREPRAWCQSWLCDRGGGAIHAWSDVTNARWDFDESWHDQHQSFFHAFRKSGASSSKFSTLPLNLILNFLFWTYFFLFLFFQDLAHGEACFGGTAENYEKL